VEVSFKLIPSTGSLQPFNRSALTSPKSINHLKIVLLPPLTPRKTVSTCAISMSSSKKSRLWLGSTWLKNSITLYLHPWTFIRRATWTLLIGLVLSALSSGLTNSWWNWSRSYSANSLTADQPSTSSATLTKTPSTLKVILLTRTSQTPLLPSLLVVSALTKFKNFGSHWAKELETSTTMDGDRILKN
jgi:hypothetical protein